MPTRLMVSLDSEEREALYTAAQLDLRPLRDQARWLIRQGLAQRGLLAIDDIVPAEKQTQSQEIREEE